MHDPGRTAVGSGQDGGFKSKAVDREIVVRNGKGSSD
jgi:hypothetical protein